MTVDAARLDRWRTAVDDPATRSFTRAAAATHLALALAETQPPHLGLTPDAASLMAETGLVEPGPRQFGTGPVDPTASRVVRRTLDCTPVGRELLRDWIDGVTQGRFSNDVIAVWLSALTHRRLAPDDLTHLCVAMTESGSTYDYRIDGLYTTRRYPTGGISEKLALILPTLLVEAARKVPVRSAFLVARSLGHTGGTWDKLSAIPGFRFPRPGRHTAEAMSRNPVSMIVSSDDYDPADRILYTLRSLTDTVECTDLIVSSIASKLCSAIVDFTILDVRYGPHSFLPDHSAAVGHARLIEEVAAGRGISIRPVYTHDVRPDGSAIGNALEVAEALVVLGLGPSGAWDLERVRHQQQLAARMLDEMLSPRFPHLPWRQWATDRMNSGDLRGSFEQLARGHGVDPATVSLLCDEPRRALGLPDPTPLTAPATGTVHAVDYSTIGRLVNEELAHQTLPSTPTPGAENSAVPDDLTAGVELVANVGDRVRQGDPLLHIYSRQPTEHRLRDELAATYRMKEDA